MSKFRAVGCRSFGAHAHHQSSGQRRRVSQIRSFRSADRQPLLQSGKVQARVHHVRRRGRHTSSPPHPRDEPEGRSREDRPDPGFHRSPRGRRSRRSGGSQEGVGEGTDASSNDSNVDTDRSGHAVHRACEKTIGGSGREDAAAE